MWWVDIEDFVGRSAASCRAERERTTARLLYALLRNLTLYAKTPGFAEDVSLTRFAVLEPVPALGDPLASFSTLESVAGVLRELIETALGSGREGPLKTLKLPPREGRWRIYGRWRATSPRTPTQEGLARRRPRA